MQRNSELPVSPAHRHALPLTRQTAYFLQIPATGAFAWTRHHNECSATFPAAAGRPTTFIVDAVGNTPIVRPEQIAAGPWRACRRFWRSWKYLNPAASVKDRIGRP